MRVINLASGSEGNLTFIDFGNKKILLDLGLSCQEALSRLKMLGIKGEQIDAIMVTHCHSDHIKGVDTFAKRFNTPVFAPINVWPTLQDKLPHVVNRRALDGSFDFFGTQVGTVEVPHDVICYGYTFERDGRKIGALTDLGHTTDKIFDAVRGSSLIYLEANYDPVMLQASTKYPLALKRRISGPNGHLSNQSSESMIEALVCTGTRQVVLAHLSKENNRPLLAYEFMCTSLAQKGIIEGQDVKIDVASPNPGVMFNLK